MKLYTKEQLRKIYDLSFINLDQDGCHIIDEDKYFEDKINELTPIELPSFDDIEKQSFESLALNTAIIGFQVGAKWMKDKILNQNK